MIIMSGICTKTAEEQENILKKATEASINTLVDLSASAGYNTILLNLRNSLNHTQPCY